MILVLNRADFSENNLGQVEITTILDEFTLNAIELSGNDSLTDAQKSALNTFFKNIGAFGTKSNIFSKLRFLYLPILAGSLDKSLINYKTSDVSLVPSNTKFQLRNKGITGVSGGTNAYIDITSSAFSATNLSVCALRTEYLATPSIVCKIGTKSTARFALTTRTTSAEGLNMMATINTGADLGGSQVTIAKEGKATTEGDFFSVSMNSDGSNNIIKVTDVTNNKYTDSSLNLDNTTSLTLFNGIASGQNSGVTDANAALGIIAIGDALTQDELVIFKNSSIALKNNLMV